MPNTERSFPALSAPLTAELTTPLSDRVARLTEAARAADERIAQASTPERFNGAATEASDFAEALAVVEAALLAVGF